MPDSDPRRPRPTQHDPTTNRPAGPTEEDLLRRPVQCRQCGALGESGQWRWGTMPVQCRESLCPACRRIQDRNAAHVVELLGDLDRCRDRVHDIVRQVERAELERNPLERVMLVRDEPGRMLLPTTGHRVARQIVANLLRVFRHGVRVRHHPEHTQVLWLGEAHQGAHQGN